MTRSALVVPFALLVAACSTGCTSACCGRAGAAASVKAPARWFVVLRATPLEAPPEGERQILIESSVVSVPGEGPIAALEKAAALDLGTAPAWLAGGQVPDVTFGPGSAVQGKPSVVAVAGEDARIQTRETGPDGGLVTGMQLDVTPTLTAQGVRLVVAYRHTENRRLVHAVPTTTLDGPVSRVFILEALPPR